MGKRDNGNGGAQTAADMALTVFEAQANERIRKAWFDGQWWFSIVDVVGVLTDSASPRKYWVAMKARIQDEGFRELLTKCQHIRLRSSDGKYYETDCANALMMISIIHALPLQHRQKQASQYISSSLCGIYALVNTITQEQYVGSSLDIADRFLEHKALLRRGKHHAQRLQEAWNYYGEEAFQFIILEEVANIEQLAAFEQTYLDERQPSYNSVPFANHHLTLPPIPPERLQQALCFFYSLCETVVNPLFHGLREAIVCGVVVPGPNFQILTQPEGSELATWEDVNAYFQQQKVGDYNV